MTHPIARCGRPPKPEYLYFALLIRAQERGTLQHEAEMLKVTLQLAEAQLRRFRLEKWRKRRRVENALRVWIKNEQIQEARKIASEYRFSLPSVTGQA